MPDLKYDVLGIGNAIVDVIARAEDDFLVKQGMHKGGMALIDEPRAQAIYRADDRWRAQTAFRHLRARWQADYPAMVKRLEKDLPELLTFFDFPRHLWRKLRTPNVIERCFVEVRRRTRPMVCFVNVASVDRIIYAIFNGYNEQQEWRNRTLHLFTQAA